MDETNRKNQLKIQNIEQKQNIFLIYYVHKKLAILLLVALFLFVFGAGTYYLGKQSVINKIAPLPTTYIQQPSIMVSRSPIITVTSINKIDSNIIQTLKNKGEALIIIQTNPPQQLINQNDEINKYKTSNDTILSDIKKETGEQGYSIYGRWDSLGSFALKISTEKALYALENHPYVKSIQKDDPVEIYNNANLCSIDSDCVLKDKPYCCGETIEYYKSCYHKNDNPQTISCAREGSCPGIVQATSCECKNSLCSDVVKYQ